MRLPALEGDAACRICGGREYGQQWHKGEFVYARCAGCRVIRMLPYPDDAQVQVYYRSYLATKQRENPLYLSDDYWTAFCQEKDLTVADLRYPLPEVRGKRVLDVGCAVGQFLRYMREHGAEPVGIDVSDELVQIARKQGLECSTRSLFELDGRFDIVSMWHVIEHVNRPADYLGHIHRLLTDGGDFLVETPCTGVISEAFGEDWRFLMPVEHVHLFSQEGLFRLLSSAGFAIVRWVRFGSGNDSGSVPAVHKRAADAVAKRLGIGDTIAVWCRKE